MSTATLWIQFQRIGATSKTNPGRQNVGPFEVEIDPDDPASIEHALAVTARQQGANPPNAVDVRVSPGMDPTRPDNRYFRIRNRVTGVQIAHGPCVIRRSNP